jgi:hypothetical protein
MSLALTVAPLPRSGTGAATGRRGLLCVYRAVCQEAPKAIAQEIFRLGDGRKMSAKADVQRVAPGEEGHRHKHSGMAQALRKCTPVRVITRRVCAHPRRIPATDSSPPAARLAAPTGLDQPWLGQYIRRKG